MSQNRFGKYLLYALGEIVLVVIGILIALQINNANQLRIAKDKEIEILLDFKRGLEFDIHQLDSIPMLYQRSSSSIARILRHLEEDLPYDQTLDSSFFDTTLIFDSGGLTMATFENLKSIGFDAITNNEIRDLIILVYDEFNPWMYEWETRYINNIMDAKRDLFNTRFIDAWNGDYNDRGVTGTMTPLDYEALKDDVEYKYYLRTQLNDLGWFIYKPSEATQLECKKLLRLIEKELNTLE